MPTVLAASTIRVPAGTVILCPSMVRFTSGMSCYSSHVAGVAEAVVLVLVVEVAHGRVDDPAGCVAQAAQAAPVLQTVRDPLEDAELQLRALVREDAVVGPDCPVAADAARGALATRLVGIEAQQSRGAFDHAVRVVHHDDPARTAHRPQGLEPVEVGGRVDHRGGEDLGRRPAGPEHLQLASRQVTAGELLDDVAVPVAAYHFVVAGCF